MSIFGKKKTPTVTATPMAKPMQVEKGIDPVIVAVIVAAIEASVIVPNRPEAPQLKFISIKRSNGIRNNWTANGTDQLINSRQLF